ncbi:hypothetical protein [uncultured Amnibacterium sp.]|uniref:hypothetical protein n=1 Tax=uncultured Amnibacterium sp. TaxID=1631851 RepID=UPI0035CAC1A2
MTTRQFDPVLSAALRNELEALADRHEVPAPLRVIHRPQVWVTVATALVLAVATLGVLQTTRGMEAPPGRSSTGASLQDPLAEITDRSSALYIGDSPAPILHARADRTRTFALVVPRGVASVRFYVVCTAGSSWTLQIDARSSGGCHGSITGYEDVPAAQLRGSATVTVRPGTEYVLLVIPTPTTTPPAVSPIRLPLLDFPAHAAPSGEPVIGRARGVTSDRVVGDMTRRAHSLFVVLTCQGWARS